MPEALIVNPNQPGCPFPSKNLAGVGVMFYVLLALRAELRARGVFSADTAPNLAQLLDIVALGTVADVVRLDANNRILVEQGLRRMRARACLRRHPCAVSSRRTRPARASASDLGFMVGPRLNAAGRLEDMSLGIACLLTDDDDAALAMAQRLHALNAERRSIEADMQATALAALDSIETDDSYSLALFDPDWHQGVIGILASRLKEKFHRPAICFARGNDGEIKGSGRSIARTALARCAGYRLQARTRPDPQIRRPCRGGRADHPRSGFRALCRTVRGNRAATARPADLARGDRNRRRIAARPPSSLELAQALDRPGVGARLSGTQFQRRVSRRATARRR